MNKLFVIAIVACGFFLSAPLFAQGGGGGGGGGNWGKGKQYKNPNGQNNGNGQGQGGGQGGQGGGQGGDDYMKRAEEAIGWGESGEDARVLPGETVKDDDKETRLNAEADKLGLEDKKIRKDFIKYGKLGWEKAEKEDSRWSKQVKKVKEDAEALEKAKAEHKTKLDEAWADADKSQTEKEILTTEQLDKFKANTKDLREKTATDISLEQDVIRARKVDELKKRAAEWAGAGAGDKEDNEVTKEKKEAEGEEEEKKEEEKKD